MLDRREIDLTAGGMLITNGRKPYVDFCIPTAELQGNRWPNRISPCNFNLGCPQKRCQCPSLA